MPKLLMREEQYRRLLQNRRSPTARLLFGSAAEARLLRSASECVRRREQAWRALESVVDPECLEAMQVDGLERGRLAVVVSDPVVCERLRRQAPRLEKQLARRVPGLQRLVVRCIRPARSGTR